MFSGAHFMLGDANDKSYCTLCTCMDLGKSSVLLGGYLIFTDFLGMKVLSDFQEYSNFLFICEWTNGVY